MAESPLLKLRREMALAAYGMKPSVADRLAGLIREAEERWEMERELHKSQVRKIRKQRHEYIMYLRTQLWLIAEEAFKPRAIDSGDALRAAVNFAFSIGTIRGLTQPEKTDGS